MDVWLHCGCSPVVLLWHNFQDEKFVANVQRCHHFFVYFFTVIVEEASFSHVQTVNINLPHSTLNTSFACYIVFDWITVCHVILGWEVSFNHWPPVINNVLHIEFSWLQVSDCIMVVIVWQQCPSVCLWVALVVINIQLGQRKSTFVNKFIHSAKRRMLF